MSAPTEFGNRVGGRTSFVSTLLVQTMSLNSDANTGKREKKKFEKLKFRYRPPTAHPRMRLGVPRGLPRAKSCLTDPKARLTHCPKARHWGDCWIAKPTLETAPMVARRVVLALPSQVPG